MRKLAIAALIILIALVVLTTMAIFNVYGIRDSLWNFSEGTFLRPGHDFIVTTWITIGEMGFTYIFASILGLTIGGGLFLVFIVHGLFWQKLILARVKKTTASSKLPFTPQNEPAEPEPAPTKTIQKVAQPTKATQETPIVEEAET